MTVGNNTLSFVYDATGAPVMVFWRGVPYYYITNLQGDVIAILDADGNIVVSYDYDAWGRLLYMSGSKASTLGAMNPLTYRGYVYDRETGLYYLQSRYYNPTIGRFINADALVATGQGLLGNNMFAYCLNNPVKYKDSQGFFTESCYDEILDLDDPEDLAGVSFAYAYNPIDAGYKYSIDLTFSSNSSLHNGGIYRLGYVVTSGYSEPGNFVNNSSKGHTPDQQALIALGKEYKKTGVTMTEAEILIEWAQEYGINYHPPETHSGHAGYWSNTLHIKIYKYHIPVIVE